MPPPVPPPPPSRQKPSPAGRSEKRSSSPSRVTEFHPDQAASPSAVIISPASDAIARCLRQSKIHWAVVGGACCVLLGSTRETTDIDIVVSKPEYVRLVKDLLKADHRFTVEPRTRQTYFHHPGHDPLQIEVLCFPSTFKIAFDSGTEVLNVNGVYLLTFAALLNSKCGCVPQRSSESKRQTDIQDIMFILLLAIDKGMRFDPNEVPNATEDLQNALMQYEEEIKQYFQAIGP
jgi:hypothetical protein